MFLGEDFGSCHSELWFHCAQDGLSEAACFHVGVLLYRFLGDKIIDQILHFRKKKEEEITEKMQCMYLWNKEMPELVVGTNLGNIWKIDLFAIKKFEEIEETEVFIERLPLYKNNSMKERILKVAVSRIGRHFLMLAYG